MSKEQIETIETGVFYIMLLIFAVVIIVVLRIILSFLSAYYGWSEN